MGTLGVLNLSMDYGATWTVKNNPPTSFSDLYGLQADPDFPDTLVAVTADGYYKSTDNAGSWTRQVSGSPGPGGPVNPGGSAPFALVSHRCSPTGGLFAIVSGPGYFSVAFSPDDAVTFQTPQLSKIASVTTGPGCAAYVTRQIDAASTNAFVAKLAPDGSTLWATYLGGEDADAPVALAVDGQDNAYVAGNTTSPDFPTTLPRIGIAGKGSVFVAKYSPDGGVDYSAVIGGEGSNTATGIALDASRNLHVLGYTSSLRFPVTPGVVVSALDSGSYTGFLLKLSSTGSLMYATYLGESYTHPGAVWVGADDQPVVAGSGALPGVTPPPQGSYPDFVMKLDQGASRVIMSTFLPGNNGDFGPAALTADASGNLLVAGTAGGSGVQSTSGAYSPSPPPFGCGGSGSYMNYFGGDAIITKLRANDWAPVYTVLLRCGGQPGAIAVDGAGAVIVALSTGSGLALHAPLLAAPACSYNSGGSSAVAKLSSDGSSLDYATYLEGCGAPGIALAKDGSIYAGVSRPAILARSLYHTIGSVFHLRSTAGPSSTLGLTSGLTLDGVANAFSGNAAGVTGGGLYSITGTGFQPPVIDLGLNPGQDLPVIWGGIQVKFDGVPAPIMRTSPGQVIVAAPWSLPAHQSARPSGAPRHSGEEPAFTSVQLFYNGTASNAVWMPVVSPLLGLLSRDFPIPQAHTNFPDGVVRNQDGTLNDADHPAALGSTITFFVTGTGGAPAVASPGAVTHTGAVVAVPAQYSSWADYTGGNVLMYPPEIFTSVPGFVSALDQVSIKVPNSVQNLNPTPVGYGGVQRVSFHLSIYPPYAHGLLPPPTSVVGAYLQ